jgi:hypothetical protein
MRQRPELLAFGEALGSASTALRRDENGDWRIKGKLGFIYAAPGTLDEPGQESFQLYCERETKQAWTWAKKLLSFSAVSQDGDTEGVLFLGRLPTPAEAETIQVVLGVAKLPFYDEEVLDVRSRHFLERADCESLWLGSPGFADELIRGEAFEGLEASGEVIGVDEVAQMRSQLIVGFVEVAFDGGVLDSAVHSFDLPIIRYEIRRRLVVRLFPKGKLAIW